MREPMTKIKATLQTRYRVQNRLEGAAKTPFLTQTYEPSTHLLRAILDVERRRKARVCKHTVLSLRMGKNGFLLNSSNMQNA